MRVRVIIAIMLLILLVGNSSQAEENDIHDSSNDIYIAHLGTNQNLTTFPQTSSEENIDLDRLSYTRYNGEIGLRLSVYGELENRGDINSLTNYNFTVYFIKIATNLHKYHILYINNSCNLSIDGLPADLIDYDIGINFIYAHYNIPDNETITKVEAEAIKTGFHTDNMTYYVDIIPDVIKKRVIDPTLDILFFVAILTMILIGIIVSYIYIKKRVKP